MPFFRSGIQTKAANQPDSPMSERAVRRLFASGPVVRSSGVPYRTDWDLDRAIREGMMRSIWTFKAVDTIAKSLAQLPIVIPQGEYLDDAVLDPREAPLLHRRLNFKANEHEFAISFRYRIIAQLLMSKKGVFIEYERDAAGEIKWMWLLNPDKVAPIPHETRFISGYEIDNNGMPDTLRPDQVLWIKIPHPTDPYMSFTPLEAAGLSIDLDYYGRLYNRNFMANDGRPGGILSVKGPVPEPDVELMRSRFRAPKPGEVTVIESDGMSFADLSSTPRDAAYTNQAEIVKNEILVAFGVGESVIGNASGRTYDNADAEENVYWRVTCKPIINFVDMHLSSLTPGDDNDDLWVRHDTTNVQALQRPIKENEQRVIEQFREGTATLNDVLRAMKKETIDRPGANTYFIAAGKIGIAADDTEQAAVEMLKAIGGGAPGEPAPMAQQPPPPNRIGRLLADRQARAQGLPANVSTARSPEAVDAARAIEASATEARRDLERKADDPGGLRHYCIAVPVPVADANHIWESAPVPPDRENPHVTVGLFDAPSIEQAQEIAQAWAAVVGTPRVSIGPDTWTWDNGGDGRPLVVKVSGELDEANEKLAQIVNASGFKMAGKGADDYKPHFTLAYLNDAQRGDLRLTRPAVASFNADRAVLHTPDGVTFDYRLGDS